MQPAVCNGNGRGIEFQSMHPIKDATTTRCMNY